MFRRIILIVVLYVVPRNVDTSAEIDILRMPGGVSSRKKFEDPSDSPGHVSLLTSSARRSY